MSRVEIGPMLQDNMSERRNIFTQNLKELVAIVLSYISNMLLICIVNVRLNHSRLKYNNLLQVWVLASYSWSNTSIHFSSPTKLIQDSDITCWEYEGVLGESTGQSARTKRAGDSTSPYKTLRHPIIDSIRGFTPALPPNQTMHDSESTYWKVWESVRSNNRPMFRNHKKREITSSLKTLRH
jgi:hypothetical protein